MVIPIFILSYENVGFLKKTIDSLNNNTLFPYKIIICDNDSKNPEMNFYLNECKKNGIIVHKNYKNLWILGLNKALNYELPRFKSEFLIVTDDDIVVPPSKDGECWLTHLYKLMSTNKYIGKLGLGLSLENIENNKNLAYIYEKEIKYKSHFLTSGIFSAHVDTTLAMYRRDIFIYDHMTFYPGHGSYIKPFYHVGRTVEFECIHLGWELYKKFNLFDKKYLNNKVFCFTICAGYLDKKVLSNCSLNYYLFYLLFSKIFRFYWGLLVIMRWVFFILKCRLIRMNGIYEGSK